MVDSPNPKTDPNDYTRQFLPPLQRPSSMPPEEWSEWSAQMEEARRIRDLGGSK